MKIYLAARYSRRKEMKENRDTLHMLGHEVTSRWIDFADMPESFEWYDPLKHGDDDSGHAAPEYRLDIAAADIEDTMRADAIMLFTPGGTRGGCFVEWGAAIAKGFIASKFLCSEAWYYDHEKNKVAVFKPMSLIVVGPRVNIFQNYPGTLVYSDFNEALDNEQEWKS